MFLQFALNVKKREKKKKLPLKLGIMGWNNPSTVEMIVYFPQIWSLNV